MSIRITALYIVVTALAFYAWKDWFKSLCGLILMMAVFEHEDMPRTMFGIPGMNMWNVLFFVVFLAWLTNRCKEKRTWDMPRYVNILLLMYLVVIVLGVVRAGLDPGNMPRIRLFNRLINDDLINTIKWALPGLLLFNGCRTRQRVIMALVSLLGLYLLVSVQVIRFMPPSAAIGDSSQYSRIRIKLNRYMGYSACDISGMLAGASWGILAALPLLRKKIHRFIGLGAVGMVAFGQALTGGRAGYVAWGTTGLLMCLIKWRKYLILAPLVVILIPILLPGVVDRLFVGFDTTDLTGQMTYDEETVGAGRFAMWRKAIPKIDESLFLGYGRKATLRTGLGRVIKETGEVEFFGHPHNVYLETLLDNGILGSLPIVLFWGMAVIYSAILFRSDNHLCSAVGGLALALTLGQMIAGIGAQHYYPRVSTLGMWAAVLLAMRVYIEKKKTQISEAATESSWHGQLAPRPAIDVSP
jgi:O-antigen ligase